MPDAPEGNPRTAGRRATIRQRRQVESRTDGTCEYCRCPSRFVPQPFTMEHITPASRGGKSIIDNLAWACAGCNLYKGDKVEAVDPQTGKTVALFHPRRQPWAGHFAWSDDATRMIGVTASGRATICALRLNRETLINLRRVLRVIGIHPARS